MFIFKINKRHSLSWETIINKYNLFSLPIWTYISIITLSVNGLNALTKRHYPNGYKNKTYIYAVCKRPTSDLETHTNWKWDDEKRHSMQMKIKRKPK